jgi:hypothetical protein
MCREVLSCLLTKVRTNNLIRRIKVARGALRITHLFNLVDDSLMFGKANTSREAKER